MIPELRMRERELKKDWIEAAKWVSAEWLSVSQPQGRRNRGREVESTETKWSETKCEERWAYVLAFEWNWAEVGFTNKSNCAFCTFFFFFWISAWFRANQPESKPCRLASAKITWNPRGTMLPDAAGRAGSGVPCTSPRRTRVRHL